MPTFSPSPRLSTLATLALVAALSACGGGEDDPAAAAPEEGGGAAEVVLECDTTLFVAGSVDAPTAAQMTKYAGTYKGDEGSFGPNIGDPFVKSGTATFVLEADGSVTYKGEPITVLSVCRDKAANAEGEHWLYVHSKEGHLDITDAGEALGISLIDGKVVFQNGKKQ
jgi:hypothetical protein